MTKTPTASDSIGGGASIATCKDCGQPFEISEAARRKGSYACKPCRAARERANYHKRAAAGIKRPNQDNRREYYREYAKEYTKRPEVRERKLERQRARKFNPVERHKNNARAKAYRAIQDGRLTRQPCEVCGSAKVEAHHDDYSKPLAVRWLCRFHHRRHHILLDRGEAA